MTGKEDKPFKITYSKEAKEMIEKENLGRIIEIIEDDFVAKVCESIYLQQIDELTQCKRKLSKYKRAFEILKDKLTFVVYESPNIPSTYFLLAEREEIEEEEVELLEELMKDA